jgi:hypothetical protein
MDPVIIFPKTCTLCGREDQKFSRINSGEYAETMNFLQSLYGNDRATTTTNIIEEKNEMIQSKRQNFKIIE